VALVAHPDDTRYQPLFGTEVMTPLFGARARERTRSPIWGSGIA
jgi:valyl-tRNA synthetase